MVILFLFTFLLSFKCSIGLPTGFILALFSIFQGSSTLSNSSLLLFNCLTLLYHSYFLCTILSRYSYGFFFLYLIPIGLILIYLFSPNSMRILHSFCSSIGKSPMVQELLKVFLVVILRFLQKYCPFYHFFRILSKKRFFLGK